MVVYFEVARVLPPPRHEGEWSPGGHATERRALALLDEDLAAARLVIYVWWHWERENIEKILQYLSIHILFFVNLGVLSQSWEMISPI